MPRAKTTAPTVHEAILELVRRRDQINAILSRHGYGDVPLSTVVPAKRRGRPPKTITKASPVASAASEAPKAAQRGPKGSAASFVLSLLKDGPKATAEINTLWKRTRKGVSDNYLTSLTKSGQIKRSPNPSGRGSQYSLSS